MCSAHQALSEYINKYIIFRKGNLFQVKSVVFSKNFGLTNHDFNLKQTELNTKITFLVILKLIICTIMLHMQ